MSTILIVYSCFAVFTLAHFSVGYFGRGQKAVHAKWRTLGNGNYPLFVLYLSIVLGAALWPVFWGFTFVTKYFKLGKLRHGRT